MNRLLITLFMILPPGLQAATPLQPTVGADSGDHPSAINATPRENTEPQDTQPNTRIDRIHRTSERMVQRLVGKVDSFFVSEEYATFSDNDTRVRLRLDADHFENSGWEVSPRIKLQLVMPGLQQRLRLVVNDGDAEESGQPSEENSDDNDIAFRWVGTKSDSLWLSYDLGIRLRGSGVDEFARVNAGVAYPVSGEWVGQTSNRLYYYAKAGWRNDFSQRFDRPLGDDYILRSRTRIQYYQDNSYNPSLEQKFSLFHTLDTSSAVAYEVLWRRQAEEDSVYGDSDLLIEPQRRYDQYAVQLRYRRTIGRPWFFVEFWPIVYWPEERDWQTSLAARIRFEVNLGADGKLKLDD